MARDTRSEPAKTTEAAPPKPPETNPASTPETPKAQAKPADLPETLYVRGSKPNPRLADVELARDNPTKSDGSPQWYRFLEKDVKTATTTANHIRRAAKELDVKVSVKLPKTEPGAVYYSIIK